eukprot:CAMPEP_0178382828 /NCGR_PEP_ID=MMETSP0689_2-20121128/6691_1 /TAXON_ID=160604 /ORGANISM="Amphidinium massartii, Strain CS-259" /LENGTH=106 /DNA_ID=CAMNT_0020003037 /DNA_START=1576 /DNA_END=1899 /DNA_ORIENTATION=+
MPAATDPGGATGLAYALTGMGPEARFVEEVVLYGLRCVGTTVVGAANFTIPCDVTEATLIGSGVRTAGSDGSSVTTDTDAGRFVTRWDCMPKNDSLKTAHSDTILQ